MIDRAAGRNLFHDFTTPAKGGDRHAAADYLAEHGDVGRDVEERLSSLQSDPEACHDFVNDEECSVLRAEAAHRINEFLCAANEVHVACECFNDDAGDFVAVLGKRIFKLFGVVVFEHHCVFCH